jgi:hypothetical protein
MLGLVEGGETISRRSQTLERQIGGGFLKGESGQVKR